MFKFLDKKAQLFVAEKIRTTLEEIKPLPGDCRYNYNCHLNSVHCAVVDEQEFITVGFYLFINQPIIHFLNYKNGQFIDNTLGVHTSNFKHYLWKRIYKEDFNRINDVFIELRKEIRKDLPWYLRWFSKYDF